ncbi:hypothetical protein Tsubulata_009795 [Turnera subulata]|uniref:Uncharacterized protein n=1 Tax=Turnera subulata TaxID=218843 RepID=A0A9Q0GIA7_9ROSI|nr:hypothetical protein Tsubulata_009795 [Turnera subulata]
MQSGTKRQRQVVISDDDDDDDDMADRIYRFKILLPNEMTVALRLTNPKPEIPVPEFMRLVRNEYFQSLRNSPAAKKKSLSFTDDHLYLEDASRGKKISNKIAIHNFNVHKCHTLVLRDGSQEIAETYEDMWDLTPDTELLRELPEEYTFETALADLIDNSLQAVWSIDRSNRRLISVEIMDDRITIFDTGPGMDDSDENSIVKWGKMGASQNRALKNQAIGGKPPYLTPYFGMFGYGGSIASMHLGKRALVSSKTKMTNKVYSLLIDRDALLRSSSSGSSWKAKGGIRNPSQDELNKSPHGSFTKVKILALKTKDLDIYQLQCKLKDIYFPYIQCDELSAGGKTTIPVEFQVNGVNLAEIDGGEVSITNLHSCNGPDFIFHLRFTPNCDNGAVKSPGLRASPEANARLKCVYIPIVEGKENIERILEKLKDERHGVREEFETFRRISVRRLGRLLPDARWAYLPFMDLRHKKGHNAQFLRRCCLRVKCYIETDAGFNPTPSKTDLAHQNHFTIALKNLGNGMPDNGKEVNVEITRHGKSLNLSQLQKAYQDWILEMHDKYDKEIDAGEDEAIIIPSLDSKTKKLLHISSDVVRVHRALERKGASWKSGQKIKILRGACPGFHKQNVYAILEFLVIEGFQEDAGGGAWILCRYVVLISVLQISTALHANLSTLFFVMFFHTHVHSSGRPMGVENGCALFMNDGIARLDIGGSFSLPISVIDSGKCIAIGDADWNYQLQKHREKAPTMIELLSAEHCQQMEVDGGFPDCASVNAGEVPMNIVAVVRPSSYVSSSTLGKLDQKYILKNDSDMSIVITFRREADDGKTATQIYSARTSPSSCEGVNGFYIFSMGGKSQTLFQRAGVYTFLFSIKDQNCKSCEKKFVVRTSSEAGKWKLLSDKKTQPYSVRLGCAFPTLYIARFDIYDKQIPIQSVPEVTVKLTAHIGVITQIDKVDARLSADKLTLLIEGIMVESNGLDVIRPNYEATLLMCLVDEVEASVPITCKVWPGSLHSVTIKPSGLKDLHPDLVIRELIFELFDSYGNHVEEGSEVELVVDGFHIHGQRTAKCKVDDHGLIDLSGVLKVTAGFGEMVSFYILSDDRIVFKQELLTEMRELRLVSSVPEPCPAGSQLENVVFEVVDSQGVVDDAIHDDEKTGQSHLLILKSDLINTESRHSFRHGSCTIPVIAIPPNEGDFCFTVSHSRYSELESRVNVSVIQTLKAVEVESVIQTPKSVKTEIQSPYSEGKILLLQDSSVLNHAGNLTPFIDKDLQVLMKYGEGIGSLESNLKDLEDRRVELQRNIDELQDSLEPYHVLNGLEIMPGREEVALQIEKRNRSAVANLFGLLQVREKDLMEPLIGSVALLGTVCDNKLSRVLAEYLGEDQMLAVVCRSYEAACALETYTETGEVACGMDVVEAGTAQGESICGRFNVICLEDIRPYTGQVDLSDQQRKLDMPDPALPDGNKPPGFKGYAVNMVNLDTDHLHTRTTAGHGLRETVLYRLLGELQVYETREQMKQARSCIQHGAVSLDGGILRGNGMITIGRGRPEICFPVLTSDSPEKVRILKDIQSNKEELEAIMVVTDRITRKLEKRKKKFAAKSKRYNELSDHLTSILPRFSIKDEKSFC